MCKYIVSAFRGDNKSRSVLVLLVLCQILGTQSLEALVEKKEIFPNSVLCYAVLYCNFAANKFFIRQS